MSQFVLRIEGNNCASNASLMATKSVVEVSLWCLAQGKLRLKLTMTEGTGGERNSYGNKIVVQTEIQQVESARSFVEKDSSVRDLARMDQREMV